MQKKKKIIIPLVLLLSGGITGTFIPLWLNKSINKENVLKNKEIQNYKTLTSINDEIVKAFSQPQVYTFGEGKPVLQTFTYTKEEIKEIFDSFSRMFLDIPITSITYPQLKTELNKEPNAFSKMEKFLFDEELFKKEIDPPLIMRGNAINEIEYFKQNHSKELNFLNSKISNFDKLNVTIEEFLEEIPQEKREIKDGKEIKVRTLFTWENKGKKETLDIDTKVFIENLYENTEELFNNLIPVGTSLNDNDPRINSYSGKNAKSLLWSLIFDRENTSKVTLEQALIEMNGLKDNRYFDTKYPDLEFYKVDLTNNPAFEKYFGNSLPFYAPEDENYKPFLIFQKSKKMNSLGTTRVQFRLLNKKTGEERSTYISKTFDKIFKAPLIEKWENHFKTIFKNLLENNEMFSLNTVLKGGNFYEGFKVKENNQYLLDENKLLKSEKTADKVTNELNLLFNNYLLNWKQQENPYKHLLNKETISAIIPTNLTDDEIKTNILFDYNGVKTQFSPLNKKDFVDLWKQFISKNSNGDFDNFKTEKDYKKFNSYEVRSVFSEGGIKLKFLIEDNNLSDFNKINFQQISLDKTIPWFGNTSKLPEEILWDLENENFIVNLDDYIMKDGDFSEINQFIQWEPSGEKYQKFLDLNPEIIYKKIVEQPLQDFPNEFKENGLVKTFYQIKYNWQGKEFITNFPIHIQSKGYITKELIENGTINFFKGGLKENNSLEGKSFNDIKYQYNDGDHVFNLSGKTSIFKNFNTPSYYFSPSMSFKFNGWNLRGEMRDIFSSQFNTLIIDGLSFNNEGVNEYVKFWGSNNFDFNRNTNNWIQTSKITNFENKFNEHFQLLNNQGGIETLMDWEPFINKSENPNILWDSFSSYFNSVPEWETSLILSIQYSALKDNFPSSLQNESIFNYMKILNVTENKMFPESFGNFGVFVSLNLDKIERENNINKAYFSVKYKINQNSELKVIKLIPLQFKVVDKFTNDDSKYSLSKDVIIKSLKNLLNISNINEFYEEFNDLPITKDNLRDFKYHPWLFIQSNINEIIKWNNKKLNLSHILPKEKNDWEFYIKNDNITYMSSTFLPKLSLFENNEKISYDFLSKDRWETELNLNINEETLNLLKNNGIIYENNDYSKINNKIKNDSNWVNKYLKWKNNLNFEEVQQKADNYKKDNNWFMNWGFSKPIVNAIKKINILNTPDEINNTKIIRFNIILKNGEVSQTFEQNLIENENMWY